MKKRVGLLLAAVLCVSTLLTACGKANQEKASKEASVEKTAGLSEEEAWKLEPAYGQTIKIGYDGGLCTASPGVASVKGFYEKNGLKTELVNVQSGIDAIGTNKIQVYTSHIAELVVPIVNGVNAVFTTGAQTGCKSLYVLNDSNINSTKDLINKTVAVPNGIGKSDHNIALRFFNHDKIDPRKVNFKPVETSATILAMQNKEVQGAVLSDQFAEKLVQDGTLKVIRSLTWDEDFKVEPCCVHVLNKDFVEKNPITAKKITLATKQASYWIEENKAEATQILFDNNWASGDFEQSVRMLESYDFKISDELTEKALTSIIDDYKSFGLIDSKLDTKKTLSNIWSPLIKDIKIEEQK
ncbi:ABC transporter periplasmic aliphatic sulfonates-binding protein SsuA [Gottschalkia acidurici 9a]|uniref:ABC transporter periplasmic aliphatic sulfonates-binding protein SsuA n=1 Tax=Gottschalkia acidurici (strain ATCC 7906 / DSM 604 / BCRC 14475 / CIP 104303 / KCTC 5404 / NCIMB 10678 / 9a) TaxID=1128398 RepID=K0B2Z8_GOTA9|nr:ABC transporter substrate-binding protein [Gottschalkia acidurici]AFS79001.1 ABC transporter periplasmic aliphatic sulfonates-binding protein SsuA [Gottschalkia acidurici 9a]